ncbi:MAG TPA: hypothetical protein VGQ90_08850 [Stellaceae bacterium]|nr:hypothetical protein [Stellaceae bacterium]
MKSFAIAALCLALAVPIGAASADPGKDKGGKGREGKVVYDDGRCKVEQKWGKKGDYKEKVECRGASPVYPYYGPDYPGYGYRYR